ncbi:MAG TPA: hypothetical protein VMH06_07240 [Thermodesulfovibrionales bacterium]|nr:hypothetical protein [Thermodesulfovibrionales bacterium]
MKAKGQVIDENALIDKLLPRIEERVRADVIGRLISALEEQLYPPEGAFRDDFVRRVEKTAKSKGKIFRTKKDLAAHLKGIAE